MQSIGIGLLCVFAAEAEGRVSDARPAARGWDGLHCDPPSGALQPIFNGFGHNPLAGLPVSRCNRALQCIGRPPAGPVMPWGRKSGAHARTSARPARTIPG